MSGTIAAAAKARLVGTSNVLSGLSGMTGVIVAYNMPRDVPEEVIYGGKISGPVELAAMKGGSGGRVKRKEDLTLRLHIRVCKKGEATTEDAETRAAALSTIVEDYIAENYTLGDLANLKLARVESVDMDSWLTDDGGSYSEITLSIALMSFLS